MADLSLTRQEIWGARNLLERQYAPRQELYNWEHVLFDNKVVNRYTNEDFIFEVFTQYILPVLPSNKECKIGDFASGGGYVSKKIVEQLRGLRDQLVFPIGVDNFRKDFWGKRQPNFLIPVVNGDLRRLDALFPENMFDAGILSFVLPFVPKNDQPAVLKQIRKVSKPGAYLVTLHDGTFYESSINKAFTPLFSESLRLSGLKDMHYLSCEALQNIATREAGFEVVCAQDLTDIAFSYYSPGLSNMILSRDFDEATRKKERKRMKVLFQEWKKKDPDSFEPEALRPRSLRLARELYMCVLRKPH